MVFQVMIAILSFKISYYCRIKYLNNNLLRLSETPKLSKYMNNFIIN